MALKKFNPRTPSLRNTVLLDTRNLSKVKPEKSLVKNVKYRAGKNAGGKITIRHKGGRVKRSYRMIDFKRDKAGVPGKVATIEYDPNRTANIALIFYADGEKRYILAPQKLEIGSTVISDTEVEVLPGNAMPLKNIPSCIMIHNIELTKGRGGQLCRSAGNSAQIMGVVGEYVQIKVPSER